MHELPLWPQFQIAYTLSFPFSDLSVPLEALPRLHIQGDLKARDGTLRCRLEVGKEENRGSYGRILRARRTPAAGGAGPVAGGAICMKCPHSPEYSLCPEAIIQWYTGSVLQAAGVTGAVPPVYDIFQYAGEPRFTMEFVEGVSAVEAVATAPAATADETLLGILAQVAILLGWLEETIRLDHRDLKADNLWIRPATPVDYTLRVGGAKWRVTAPFQVVLLDFGFACLGDETGAARINLSDGLLPAIDPCPKPGRDIFHVVASILSVPQVRARLSPGFQAQLNTLLSGYAGATSAAPARAHWIYLVTSDPVFKALPLQPEALLAKLSTDWKGGATVTRLE